MAMAVVVRLQVDPRRFELGRILSLEGPAQIELEEMVPMGQRAVPFFTVHDDTRAAFEAEVGSHPSVTDVQAIGTDGDATLYALDWAVENDLFFRGIVDADAQLLTGEGTASSWEFELRFPTHEALGAFQQHCSDTGIPIEVKRLYNPTPPDAGIWFGLTAAQRETLVRAVQAGYYSIPSETSTRQLAEEFDISDQAVTERLRRAIDTLVENTLIASEEHEPLAVE